MNPIKKLVAAISAAFSIFSAYATVFYVTPDGTGSGTSWSDATTLDALSADLSNTKSTKVVKGDTIRMKAGTYTMTARVDIKKPITIEGGYKGEVDDDLTLADVPETVLEGGYKDSASPTEAIWVEHGSGTNYFYRLTFKRFYRRGFFKKGAASLEMYDCSFLNNSPTIDLSQQESPTLNGTGGGRGGCFIGSASSSFLVLSNCVFQGNVLTRVLRPKTSAETRYSAGFGFGANFYNWKKVSLSDCRFIDNGIDSSVTNVSDSSSSALYAPIRYGKGAAFYAYNAPIKAVNCKFIGNNYLMASDTSPL
jgi:hypothetical protein